MVIVNKAILEFIVEAGRGEGGEVEGLARYLNEDVLGHVRWLLQPCRAPVFLPIFLEDRLVDSINLLPLNVIILVHELDTVCDISNQLLLLII